MRKGRKGRIRGEGGGRKRAGQPWTCPSWSHLDEVREDGKEMVTKRLQFWVWDARWCHLLGMLWLSFDHTMLGEEVGTGGPGWKWGEKRTLVGQFYKQDCLSWLFRTLDCPWVIKCFAMDCLVKSFCNGKLKNWNSMELLYSK